MIIENLKDSDGNEVPFCFEVHTKKRVNDMRFGEYKGMDGLVMYFIKEVEGVEAIMAQSAASYSVRFVVGKCFDFEEVKSRCVEAMKSFVSDIQAASQAKILTLQK